MHDLPEDKKQKVAEDFQSKLNSHGYGFQYALLEKINNYRKSHWVREAAEFPVQVQSQGTRIDFVLRRDTTPPCFMIAECKRANPALSNWCFLQAPFVQRDRADDNEPLFLEYLHWDENGAIRSCARGKSSYWTKAFHIALTVKSDQKGDASGEGRGVIEEAATQVCRGLNGMVEFLSNNPQVLISNSSTDSNSGKKAEVFLFPAIFTTARLWASEVDLKLADLDTGEVSAPADKFTEKKFLLYQYHLSPGIKHSRSPEARPKKLGELMDSEYVRSIAIVNPSGVEEFLKWSSDLNLL